MISNLPCKLDIMKMIELEPRAILRAQNFALSRSVIQKGKKRF